MGTDLAQKHSGWQIAPWRMSYGTTKAVRHEAKTLQLRPFLLGLGIRSWDGAAELADAAERPQWSLRASVGSVAGAH